MNYAKQSQVLRNGFYIKKIKEKEYGAKNALQIVYRSYKLLPYSSKVTFEVSRVNYRHTKRWQVLKSDSQCRISASRCCKAVSRAIFEPLSAIK